MSRDPSTTETATASRRLANRKTVDPASRTVSTGAAAKALADRNDQAAAALRAVGHRLRRD